VAFRFVELPEPTNYTDIDLHPDDPWRRAAERVNWRGRAFAFDELLIDSLAVAVASGTDVKVATGIALHRLTCAIEEVCDCEIRGPDAAPFYLLTVHPEWRAAGRKFFQINKLDPAAVIRSRPGVRLVHAICLARVVLAKEGVNAYAH